MTDIEKKSLPWFTHKTAHPVRKASEFHLLPPKAVNDFGVGERTETISASTSGSAPIPPTSKSLIKVNATSVDLDLNSWQTGGCPISSFVVEYRGQDGILRSGSGGSSANDWILVNNNVKHTPSSGRGFTILDLSPETRYTLKITAHNAAGSTVHEYDFTTLTFSGGEFQNARHVRFRGSGNKLRAIPKRKSKLLFLRCLCSLVRGGENNGR